MTAGLDEDAPPLSPRTRALGIVAALVFVFAVVDASVVREAPPHLLWVCHVAAPLLALGFALSNAALLRLAFAPACAALPLGVAGLVDPDVGVSVFTAIALPVVAVVGVKSVGAPRGVTRWTLASLGFAGAVAVVGRAIGDGTVNVNLALHAPAALGALSGPPWWLALVVFVALFFGGLHVAAGRAFGAPAVGGEQKPASPTKATATRSYAPSRTASPALRVARASEVDPALRAIDAEAEASRSGPTAPATTPRASDAAGQRDEVVRPRARTNAALSSAQLAAALAEVKRTPIEPPASGLVAAGLGMAAPVPLPPAVIPPVLTPVLTPTSAGSAPATALPGAFAASSTPVAAPFAPATPLPGSFLASSTPVAAPFAPAPIVPIVAFGGEAHVAGPAVPVPVVVGGDIIQPARVLGAIDAPTDQHGDRRTEDDAPRVSAPGTEADDALGDLDAPTVAVTTAPARAAAEDAGDASASDLDAPTVATPLPPPGGAADGDDAGGGDDDGPGLDAPTVAIPVLTRQRGANDEAG